MADEKLCECGCGQAVGVYIFTNRARGYVEGDPRRFIQGHCSTRGPLVTHCGKGHDLAIGGRTGRGDCRQCNIERQRTYRARRKAAGRPIRPPSRRHVRGYTMKYKYGLTLEQFDALLIAQEGRCAICERISKNLVVDHCHATNVVRGLLCPACNAALGQFSDETERLRAALRYLERI